MSVVSCFGEILWDIFPNYSRIGGAPLNVALRLASLGDQVWMISKLGKDPYGDQILEYLKKNKLSSQFIQADSLLPTGSVLVELDKSGTASYTITKPVAWDAIEWREDAAQIVQDSKAFVFGTLACRSELSLKTLKRFLEIANQKVFDVNLRPPHFHPEIIKYLLGRADLIKMNEEELELILSYYKVKKANLKEGMTSLQEILPKHPDLCVTRGGKGAILNYQGKFYENPGIEVKVLDTVGAGDSFLAMLLHELLSNTSAQRALDLACAMGSAVATKPGATQEVSDKELYKLLRK